MDDLKQEFLQKNTEPVHVTSATTSNEWIQDDLNQYPLLKSSSNRYNHWSAFKKNLQNIMLQDDSISSVAQFWNNINSAFMSTLKTDLGCHEYKDLTHMSHPELTLIPVKSDARAKSCVLAYNNFFPNSSYDVK